MLSQCENKDVLLLKAKGSEMEAFYTVSKKEVSVKSLIFLAERSLSLATKLDFSLELSALAWCCFTCLYKTKTSNLVLAELQ